MNLTKELKRKRFLMMLSSALAIFFTGFPHVWSVYQPYALEQAGWSQTQASMCFYLALGIFVFGNIYGGRMMEVKGAKKVMWVGGGIFSVGVVLSAFLIMPNPILFYITYGAMQGFGQGMIYTTIIATAQKWFPGRTGFASGIVVTANGLCGFFLAPLSRMLLGKIGPQYTLFVIGIMVVVAWLASSILFADPDKELQPAAETNVQIAEESKKQYTSAEMVKTKKFYYLLATMCFGLMSYFMISPISQSYQMEIGIQGSIAITAVMIGSMMNAATRLLLPTAADKIGRIPCIQVILIVCAVAMGILGITKSGIVTIMIIVVYGCYGGIMGSFPSFTSSIFGIKHSGENYGYVMFGLVIATFGAPAIVSTITASGLGMNVVFLIGMLFAVAALISLQFLKKELRREDSCL